MEVKVYVNHISINVIYHISYYVISIIDTFTRVVMKTRLIVLEKHS